MAAVLGACALFARGRVALLLLAAGLFVALGALAVGINAEWVSTLDTSVEDWFVAHRSRHWQVDANGIFRFVGLPVHVSAAAVVCGSLLSLKARSMRPLVLVIGAVGIGVVVEQTLKAIVTRTATTVATVQAEAPLSYQHSFPSGHVTGAAALLGTIAVCIGIGRSRAARATLTVLVVTAVLAVAFLALYSHAHTFSDVVGGVFLGGACVSMCAALLGASATVSTNRGT